MAECSHGIPADRTTAFASRAFAAARALGHACDRARRGSDARPPVRAHTETVGAGAKMPVRKQKAGLDQGRDQGWVLLLHA
jgi:hypothetical protein